MGGSSRDPGPGPGIKFYVGLLTVLTATDGALLPSPYCCLR